MRRWLPVVVAMLLLAVPVRAQSPSPDEKREAEKMADKVLDEMEARQQSQMRLEVYYNKAFFGEPWRVPDTDIAVEHETGAVFLVTAAGLAWLIRTQRSA